MKKSIWCKLGLHNYKVDEILDSDGAAAIWKSTCSKCNQKIIDGTESRYFRILEDG